MRQEGVKGIEGRLPDLGDEFEDLEAKRPQVFCEDEKSRYDSR
ncbi:hypothetical protein SSCH_590012 [Syntrophaceticus schinkii]|uniref:Uncharacterized protein n=1 Tax=Syntrophaceticus schinkii TaxID=499207 RepID=A0A0B7MPX6_9FIRM|nr:hypothetical protein SSCH_590012 [Syntrophaceticus schinkii]